MDKGRVTGIDIKVEKASEENGYVELTPEAEQNSWAMIGKAAEVFSCFSCTVQAVLFISSCRKKSHQAR